MVVHKQNSIKHLTLKLVLQTLIGADNQRRFDAIDWHQESDLHRQQGLIYPHYYTSQNFHGIEGGYLNQIAAITYDAVTALASPPNEIWIRRQMVAAVSGLPQQILDIGCGTGTSTLMLKQAFSTAAVTGLDLSPYMLVAAAEKARKKVSIEWQHGLAEATGFEDERFDLVTASFLFHETPVQISQLILQECFRLLKPGGQVLILDGNQRVLRRAGWLIRLFREPYSQVYATGSVQAWMDAAGFNTTQTKAIGWIHQISSGIK